ncbi:Uncharacterised protein [Mycobacteroides abscessus subsp. abscessus]|nr:Uncharacterised protein [Mycobacteroides abscessus subsp. abscessus]
MVDEVLADARSIENDGNSLLCKLFRRTNTGIQENVRRRHRRTLPSSRTSTPIARVPENTMRMTFTPDSTRKFGRCNAGIRYPIAVLIRR